MLLVPIIEKCLTDGLKKSFLNSTIFFIFWHVFLVCMMLQQLLGYGTTKWRLEYARDLRPQTRLGGGSGPAICLIQKLKPFKFLPFMLSDHMWLLKKIVSWTRWMLKTINLLWTYLQNCENSVVTWFFCKLCVLYWLLQLYIMFLPDVLWCYRPVLNKIKLMILTKFVFQ